MFEFYTKISMHQGLDCWNREEIDTRCSKLKQLREKAETALLSFPNDVDFHHRRGLTGNNGECLHHRAHRKDTDYIPMLSLSLFSNYDKLPRDFSNHGARINACIDSSWGASRFRAGGRRGSDAGWQMKHTMLAILSLILFLPTSTLHV